MTLPIKLTYFDTAMMLLEIGPFRLLTDPVLDPAGTAYEDGPVQLYKSSAATSPAQLGPIDAVLLSHDQHDDNLDRAGRAFLSTVPRVLTTPTAAARLGANAEGLEAWATTTLSAPGGTTLTVTALPAQHGPDGTQDLTGPVTGFLLASPLVGDSNPIYISGDTVPFPGLDQIAKRYAPIGLAILHIGRVQIAAVGDITLSLSAEEAIAFAQSLQARQVIPIHCEGWRHFTQNQSAAAEVFSQSHIANRVLWLSPGQPHSF